MRRFTPVLGFVIVILFMSLFWLSQSLLRDRLNPSGFLPVRPDESGQVRIAVGELAPAEVRFYRFLNPGNQEVRFFVGRDPEGRIQVAFDASESHARLGRGFRHEGEWVVDNKCDSVFRLSVVNDGGGGCKPVPLRHRLVGEQLVLAEADILAGWRLFS